MDTPKSMLGEDPLLPTSRHYANEMAGYFRPPKLSPSLENKNLWIWKLSFLKKVRQSVKEHSKFFPRRRFFFAPQNNHLFSEARAPAKIWTGRGALIDRYERLWREVRFAIERKSGKNWRDFRQRATRARKAGIAKGQMAAPPDRNLSELIKVSNNDVFKGLFAHHRIMILHRYSNASWFVIKGKIERLATLNLSSPLTLKWQLNYRVNF